MKNINVILIITFIFRFDYKVFVMDNMNMNKYVFHKRMIDSMIKFPFSDDAFDALQNFVSWSDNFDDLRRFLSNWSKVLTNDENGNLKNATEFQFYRDFMNGV